MEKILYLNLTRKWFDMIASGEKTEEYRELKLYWIKRLTREHELGAHPSLQGVFKTFDIVRFKNGYSKGARTMDAECRGITKGWGNPAWGGSSRDSQEFIIKLGNIISPKK